MKRLCRLCKKPFSGRSDKIFCTPVCKAIYHRKLNFATHLASFETDKILHRNRSILLEVMGKHKKQKLVESIVLERKKFRFNYMTGLYENVKGKRYHIVYDFSWMKFSNGKVLILRRG